MLLHALTLCLLGAQVDHASLHASASIGYFELPDVQRLLSACDQSTVANFVRDPELAPLWKKVNTSPVPAGGMRQALLELSISDAEQRAKLEPMFASLRAISVSLDLDRNGLDELARAGQLATRAHEQLTALQEELDEHAIAHDGTYPASLDELEQLDADARTDPWGNAVVYSRSEDGAKAELKSFGSDGAAGGTGSAADWTPASSLRSRTSDMGSELVSGTIAFEFSDAAIAASAADAWRAYRAGLTLDKAKGVPSACANADRFLLLGFGGVEESALSRRLADRTAAPAAVGSPRARIASLGARTPSTVLQVGLALASSELNALFPELPAVIARAFAPVGAWRVQFEGGQFETISRTDASGWLGSCLRERGELSLAEAERRAPTGALFSLVAALDLQSVAREASAVLESIASKFAEASPSASAPAGPQVDVGAIASALERLAVHTSGPMHMWVGSWDALGPPPTYAVFELSDPVRFAEELLELPRALPEEFVEQHPLRVRPYQKTPITTWNLPGTQAGMFEPSWCILGNEFVLSTSRTSLTNEIKRRRKLDPQDAKDAATAASPVAGGDALLAWRCDVASVGESLLTMGRNLSRLGGGMFPSDMLPKSGVFQRHFRPLTGTTRRDGAELLTRRSADLLVDLSIARLLLRMGTGEATAEATAEDAPAEDVPDSGLESDRAADAQTAVGLRALENGLVVYLLENGGYPEKLETLLEPTSNFPAGYLESARELPRDGQQQPFAYARSATGYRLWSIGANGRDEAGAGDDVLVERSRP